MRELGRCEGARRAEDKKKKKREEEKKNRRNRRRTERRRRRLHLFLSWTQGDSAVRERKGRWAFPKSSTRRKSSRRLKSPVHRSLLLLLLLLSSAGSVKKKGLGVRKRKGRGKEREERRSSRLHTLLLLDLLFSSLSSASRSVSVLFFERAEELLRDFVVLELTCVPKKFFSSVLCHQRATVPGGGTLQDGSE